MEPKVVIEEQGNLGPGEIVALIILGAALMAVAVAIALAIVQLSFAFSVAVVAIGLGLGGSLLAGGVARVIIAKGQAQALTAREMAHIERARAEIARAHADAEWAQTERARLSGHAWPVESRAHRPR